MKQKKNYPLYETTVFKDFRIMTENVAKKYPNRIAFSYKNAPSDKTAVQVSFAQVRDAIRDYGTAMISLDLRDRHCAIIGSLSLGWVYSFFGLMSIGAVTVPLDKEMPAADLAATVTRAECSAVFYSADVADKIEVLRAECPTLTTFVCFHGNPAGKDFSMDQLIEQGHTAFLGGNNAFYDYEIDPDRLASIVFTSGTTGKGKGVMLSQTNIVSDMTQGMYNFAITPKTMMILPPHHTFGSTVNLVGNFSQGTEVYLSSGIKYFVRELSEQQPTHLILVPLFIETMYKRIIATAEKEGRLKKLQTGVKLSNFLLKLGIDRRKQLFADIHKVFGGKVQMIICGGAALNQDIIDFFQGIGITLLNGYGITECAPLISCNRNEYQEKGSVGTPIIGEKVKIANPDINGEGEICVKGPNVMMGYYKDPEATKAAFDEEGYFRTGDYGKLDRDGWIYITGRLKNLIIFSNGKNVYPEEIETEISRIYGVAESVVYAGISRQHPEKEIIVAEIYPDTEALKLHQITDARAYFEEEIKAVNGRMAPYKKIGALKLRDTEFPKNTSKKIVRYSIDRSID